MKLPILAFLMVGCIGPDLNGDGKISRAEAAKPVVDTAKTIVDTAIPGAKGVSDWLYGLIYGAPALGTVGGAFVAKRGSKKRHKEQEEKHKAELKLLKEEISSLHSLVVELSKRPS